MLAVIGGSGLDQWEDARVVREHAATTAWGEASAAPRELQFDAARCLFLPRHGSGHHLAPHAIDYRANVLALHDAGASAILAVNAVGGITTGCSIGALVLPDDLIDYTWGRAHTFFERDRVEHVEFTEPYTPALRQQLIAVAHSAAVPIVKTAVYAATQGPRLETPAEIRRLQRDGCDIVGMTGMPEAALARELKLPYAALCLVVNPAAGIGDEVITMAAIEAALERGMATVRNLLEAVIAAYRQG